jgi:putative ABC transport system substrate-binding protein
MLDWNRLRGIEECGLRRRDFIGMAGAAATWPQWASAEKATVPVLGYVGSAFADASAKRMGVLRQSLAEAGFIVGQNLAIEYRWAENRSERLPALAADLVERQAKVIIADGTDAVRAVRRIAGNTPIVFLTAADPVGLGWVRSLNQPGTNLTGVAMLATEVTQKRAELLVEAVPTIKTVAFFANAQSANFIIFRREMESASHLRGFDLRIFAVTNEGEFDGAFHRISQMRPSGMVVQADPWLDARAVQLIGLAAKYELPAIYQWREQTEAGGLLSFGVDLREIYRIVGNLAGRVLTGVSPGEIPVQQATKIELIVNLKTARALRLRIAESILLRADEVIE